MSGPAQSFQPDPDRVQLQRLEESTSAAASESTGRLRVLFLSFAAVMLIDAGLGLMALSDANAAQKIAAVFIGKARASPQAVDSGPRGPMRVSLDRDQARP